MKKIKIISALHKRGPDGGLMGSGPLYLIDNGLLDSLKNKHPEISFERTVVNSIEMPSENWQEVLELSRAVKDNVIQAINDESFPIVLGSGCLTSIGVVAALHSLGVVQIVWLDKHADLNTPETSGSGNKEGMPLGLLTGQFGQDVWEALTGNKIPVELENVLLLGGDDLDPFETDVIHDSAMSIYSINKIRERSHAGIPLFSHLFGSRDQIYLHLDSDVLDPEQVPDTGSPTDGGLTTDEIGYILRSLPVDGLKAITVTGIIPKPNSTSRSAESIISILDGLVKQISS